MLRNRFGLAAVLMTAIVVTASVAGATTISVSTDVLNGGNSGAGNQGQQSSASNNINYIAFIPNNANAAAVQYDNAGSTANLAPNIYALGAARGDTQGIQVNTYGPIGGSLPGGDTNLWLAGQNDVNNPGFGAHANWVVTLNLDAIRTNLLAGSTATLNLTGSYGAWGAIGDPTSNGGNTQGEIWLDGTRIDSMPLATFSPVLNPTFNLNLPNSGHELSFFILNSPTSSNWDDGIFENVNIATVPEPGSLVLFGLGAIGLLMARRRRK